MSPDHPPSPDSTDPPDNTNRQGGAAPDSDDRPETNQPTAPALAARRARHRLHHARRVSLAAAVRLLTWLRTTLAARSSTNLHRMHPRMRALQLGSAALAVGVLSVLVGGVNAPPQGEKVDLASAHRPLTAPAPTGNSQPVQAWAGKAAETTSVPAPALHAYAEAAQAVQQKNPGCEIPWTVLAGIGRVESNHARFGGASLLDSGKPSEPIIGIPLNGVGVKAITDTDDGTLDGDPVHDRAVGPMQFIPSTWQAWSTDGNGDGVTDPQNLYDAAATAGNYLCGTTQGQSLAAHANQREALMAYNQSSAYGAKVLRFAEQYASVEAPPTSIE